MNFPLDPSTNIFKIDFIEHHLTKDLVLFTKGRFYLHYKFEGKPEHMFTYLFDGKRSVHRTFYIWTTMMFAANSVHSKIMKRSQAEEILRPWWDAVNDAVVGALFSLGNNLSVQAILLLRLIYINPVGPVSQTVRHLWQIKTM